MEGDTYTSLCLGPFSKRTVLTYTITAEDKAENTAVEEFNITVVEEEVKIEGHGEVEDGNTSVKLELEVKWKKDDAKGEFELKEEVKEKKEKDEKKGKEDEEKKSKAEEKEEKFTVHGKIDSMYKDCDGVFQISGLAEIKSGEEDDKVKEEDVPFTGSITGDEIKIVVQDREFVVPAKVKIKEGVEEKKDEDGDEGED